MSRRGIAGAIVALGLGVGIALPAAAQSPETFYRGKTITVVVGYSVGGGYDIYARVLARHLGRHVPGTPGVVVQNMPGAGSQKALEFLLALAPKDGTTLATFGRTLPIAPMIENAKFDPSRLEWIGSITSDTSTCIAWHTSPIKTWDDMRKRQFTVGGLGKGSDPEMFATLLKVMFGLDIKLVSGYPGTNDVTLAMERGEVEGMCGYSYSSLRASRRAWLDERKVAVLMQAGMQRDPSIPPDVPMLLDKTTSAPQREALSLILAPQAVARPFAMPPGAPADRVAAVRAAFMATMSDREFMAEAKTAGLDIDPLSGDEIAKLYSRIFATPAPVVAEARRGIGN